MANLASQTQVQIQKLVRGAQQIFFWDLPMARSTGEQRSKHTSARSRAHLRALEALAFLSVKYAFLPLFLYFFFQIFQLIIQTGIWQNILFSWQKILIFFENEVSLPKPKIANAAKWSHVESQPYAAAVQGCFRTLEALGVSWLRYAFFHFLETLFLSFLTFTSTPKMDKVVPSIWISEICLCYLHTL